LTSATQYCNKFGVTAGNEKKFWFQKIQIFFLLALPVPQAPYENNTHLSKHYSSSGVCFTPKNEMFGFFSVVIDLVQK
jgi:hypothetical protein